VRGRFVRRVVGKRGGPSGVQTGEGNGQGSWRGNVRFGKSTIIPKVLRIPQAERFDSELGSTALDRRRY